MLTNTNPSIPIIHSSVSLASSPTTLLAATSVSGDLSALAAACLAAAPRFHRRYSHTAGGRIYAFLFTDPFVYFAISDESLGKPQTLAFLSAVNHAFLSFSPAPPFSPLCFQESFSPELRRLAASAGSQGLYLCPPPPTPTPTPAAWEMKKNGGFEGDVEDLGRKSGTRVWGHYFRTVVMFDLVFCCLLFGIWLSICRGFQCVGR